MGLGGCGWLSQAKEVVCLLSHSSGNSAESVYGPEPPHAGDFIDSFHARLGAPTRPGLGPSNTGNDVDSAKDILEMDCAQKAGLPLGAHPTPGCSCCPGFLPPRLPFLRSRSLPPALPSSEMVNNSLHCCHYLAGIYSA